MALRLLIIFFLLVIPAELPGCGPFIPDALFTLKLQPERPDAEFAQGKLGVVSPTYMRFYLVIAYRYFSGVGLNDAERNALFPSKPAAGRPPAMPDQLWLAARKTVPGVKPIPFLDVNRPSFDANNYDYFQNCNDDAFRVAADTLTARMKQYGASSPLVSDWIAAQDTVFSNCSGTQPAIPPPASDQKLRADRTYQIAAARFYAGQYDAARADFQQIAADSASPWHEIAPYLEARCTLRKGDLAKASAELRAIADDSSQGRWRAAAARLLQYVNVRLDPNGRIRELAQTLVKPNIQDHIAEDLDDYRLLLDKVDKPPREDELTDWIKSYQEGDRDHVFEMWHKHQSLPWLVAALEETKPGDVGAAELLKSAAVIKPDSPGYITISWHAVRLMPDDEARAKADEVLKLDMTAGARNLFLGRRMGLARSFEEFLKYAPRTVVGSEADVEEADPKDQKLLGEDSASVLNHLPLDLLREAASSALLPENVRQQLENMIWTRSVVLQPTPSFDDIYKLLKTPGLHFDVDYGFGRYTEDIHAIDPFRANWWCSPLTPNADAGAHPKPAPPFVFPSFVTPGQAAEGKREFDHLGRIPIGANWLSAQVLAWAQKIPDDPRMPEALHLAVRATRYGCTDSDTGDFSKRAFDLLHRRYPNSPWASQTKYWFR